MTNQSKLEIVHDNIHALPLVETDNLESLLSEREALRVWRDLQELPSTTRERIHTQIESVEFDLITKLDFDHETGKYRLSPSELRYVLSRMAITAAAQEASDVGRVLKESAQLRTLVEGLGSSAFGGGGGDQPPLDEQQSDQS